VLQQDPDTMQVTINHVYEGSPAESAGIKDGDMIIQVDDITATSMELSELVTHIRGDKGTQVHLKIYREGESDYLEFDVTRDVVDVPTVSGQMLDDGIGYIAIAEFGDKTATEFSEQVKELEQEGMTSMIVDLRDNPGGMVDSVTEILDQILPEGVTVWTEDKQGRKKEYTSDADCMDYPMAVLINGNSASSSEIFAGAIRDYEYGTLIGTKTFGKGIVQSIRKLSDGSAIKLTTAKYFTPSGENIHGEGIAPDIELEYEYLDPDATEYNIMDDNQVRKAIEVLTE
jgi:carboxyl-terminal processing protease